MRIIKEYEWCQNYGIDCVTIDIYDNQIVILNGHKIIGISQMMDVIRTIRKYTNIFNKSDFKLISEWRAHNLLKTRDTNFNPDISTLEMIGYTILSLFYWKF